MQQVLQPVTDTKKSNKLVNTVNILIKLRLYKERSEAVD